MKKSELKTQLRKKAENQFDKQWQELFDYLRQHPIASQLFFEQGKQKNKIHLVSHYRNDSLINEHQNVAISGNFKELRKKLIDRYEQDATSQLLDSMDSIKYLLENRAY